MLEVKGAQFNFVFLSVPFHHLNGFSFYFVSFAGISLAGWCLKWIVKNWFLQLLCRHQYPLTMASNPTLGEHVLPPYASLSSSLGTVSSPAQTACSDSAATFLWLVKSSLQVFNLESTVLFLQDDRQVEGRLWECKMALYIPHLVRKILHARSSLLGAVDGTPSFI